MLADLLQEAQRFGNKKAVLRWVFSPQTVRSLGKTGIVGKWESVLAASGTAPIADMLWGYPVEVDLTKEGPFGALVSMHVAV